MQIAHIIILLLAAFFAAYMTGKNCLARWPGNSKKVIGVGCTLTIIVTAVSVILHGLGIHNVQAIILCCVFLYSSYGDIKTHEADDFIHVLILTAALITKSGEQIPESLITAVMIVSVMLLVAVLVKGVGIGGADIKFCAACAFLSNFSGGLIGLLLGMFLALVFNSPFRRKEEGEKPKGFPMLPYLSCSYMLVYLLSF